MDVNAVRFSIEAGAQSSSFPIAWQHQFISVFVESPLEISGPNLSELQVQHNVMGELVVLKTINFDTLVTTDNWCKRKILLWSLFAIAAGNMSII